MKSTYKLFGAYWDGMKTISDNMFKIEDNSSTSPNSISFARLLSVQEPSDYDSALSSLDTNISAVSINVDYWTNTSNPVLHC